MKTIFGFLILSILMTSCRSHPTAVNSPVTWPEHVLPMTTSNARGENYSTTLTAVSGTIFLKSELPVPLAQVRIGLYQIVQEQRKFIYEFSSNERGAFEITRPIDRGVYELVVTDPRYMGEMRVSLLEKPEKDLIFEVSKRP